MLVHNQICVDKQHNYDINKQNVICIHTYVIMYTLYMYLNTFSCFFVICQLYHIFPGCWSHHGSNYQIAAGFTTLLAPILIPTNLCAYRERNQVQTYKPMQVSEILCVFASICMYVSLRILGIHEYINEWTNERMKIWKTCRTCLTHRPPRQEFCQTTLLGHTTGCSSNQPSLRFAISALMPQRWHMWKWAHGASQPQDAPIAALNRCLVMDNDSYMMVDG